MEFYLHLFIVCIAAVIGSVAGNMFGWWLYKKYAERKEKKEKIAHLREQEQSRRSPPLDPDISRMTGINR